MKLHTTARWVRRLALLTAIMGATTFQTQGCLAQPAREALLLGLQDTFKTFMTTLVDTFFLQLTTPTSQPMETVI